jgi:hypothetical protein
VLPSKLPSQYQDMQLKEFLGENWTNFKIEKLGVTLADHTTIEKAISEFIAGVLNG